MARPGLKPGTPRFSVVAWRAFSGHESPANKLILGAAPSGAQCRYLRTFSARLWDEVGLVPRLRGALEPGRAIVGDGLCGPRYRCP
jgi:hypothetical protein